ncbi:MAG: sensor histidine kinase [Oscillospiraceae bacterium]|nr:sensor histidine kinase [Oscillospiraceae bacterium]
MNVILHDIPRLYTGIAEWAACMMYVLLFPPRLRRQLQIPAALGCLVIQCVFLVVTDDVPLVWWIPCMVTAFAMMVGQLLLLGDMDLRTACHVGVHAFVLAEFAAALEWQLHYFLWGEQDPAWWQQYILLAAVFGVVYLVSWIIASRLMMPPGKLMVSKSELFIVVIIGIIVFAMSNLSFYDRENPFSAVYARDIMNIRTLVDFAGNTVLIAYFIQRKQNHSQKELAALQTVLENQYAQYRMSRDTIDLINRKYHDLKHQIAALRAEPDAEVRERWLREMEEDIRAYEAQNKTGNHILDTVLTGKSLQCQNQGIELVVVADGRVLDFMDLMDICTIFGNALDNAIECEMKIADPSKRMIRLMLSAQKSFLLLKVENYCPTPPDFRDGLPATTKRDTDNHGFGLKSIRNTAQKYGGSMTTAVEDNWFVLKVLIPMKTK